MTLDELEKLAGEPGSVVSERTIKSLIALCRMQHETLKAVCEHYVPDSWKEPLETLNAFKEWETK